MKRTWIKVKRGLLTAEHYRAMGAAIWAFLLMIDNCDWTTGELTWSDAEAAAEFGVGLQTMRDWRQRLTSGGYVVSRHGGHCLKVVLNKWVDPRLYPSQSDVSPLSDAKQSDVQPCQSDTFSVRPSISTTLTHTKDMTAQQSAVQRSLFAAISKTCKVDGKTSGASLGKVAKVLAKAGYVEADIQAFDKWWWGDKKMRQRPPTIWQLQEQIGVVRAKKEEEKPKEQWIPPSMRA